MKEITLQRKNIEPVVYTKLHSRILRGQDAIRPWSYLNF